MRRRALFSLFLLWLANSALAAPETSGPAGEMRFSPVLPAMA